MPEYRHNLITNRWVIIASRRSSRPRSFAHSSQNKLTDFDPECPFCPGNEKMTPPETFALRDGNSGADTNGWSLRVVPNKFPFLDFGNNANDGNNRNNRNNKNNEKGKNGEMISKNVFDGRQADGMHEVLIESPRHDVHFAQHNFDHACVILRALRNRYRCLAEDGHIKHISIFCNHGLSSGASLAHPHFQIAAGSVVPPRLAGQIACCRQYLATHGRSVFETTLENELGVGERLIARNDNFLAFCPAASMCAYEVYILPRFAQAQFGSLEDKQIPDLTEILQRILARLDEGQGNTDYNLVFHTAATDTDESEKAFCWYIQIFPHVSVPGGYELATDIYINTTAPATAAAFYRDES
ncbi:MAG: hypothetical protein KAJ52_02950 [Sedimentisphaerales bacterium]|nr:hypothetical protein [Sedimentisphaerales bacterium]